MKTLIEQIGISCQAYNQVFEDYKKPHLDKLHECIKLLPSGSGIDSGCKIDIENSGINKVIIIIDFHHMDEHGYYCGWETYKLIAKPTFAGIDMKITGRDKYFIKDYLYELFDHSLNAIY